MLRSDKKQKFEVLAENVARCDLCERMHDRVKVLSAKNGDLSARVMFIAEAPGRLGADRTQVPLHGDQTGRNFERLLHFAGLRREEVFVTNAVLCNPRDEKDNNSTPNCEEIRNCSLHLSLVVDIVQPELLVPLGRSALAALNIIESHSIELRRDARKPMRWAGYTVLPLYHPGPRVFAHRSLSNQIGDFYAVGELVGKKRHKVGVSRGHQSPLFERPELSLLQKAALRIIGRLGSVSKFKLTKLLYLVDWHNVKMTGSVLTGCYYMFQKEGPIALGLSEALIGMQSNEVRLHFEGRRPIYAPGTVTRADMELPGEVSLAIDKVLRQYGHLTDAQIKVAAYLTDPMREILRRQRSGERMLNYPVFQGWVDKISGENTVEQRGIS